MLCSLTVGITSWLNPKKSLSEGPFLVQALLNKRKFFLSFYWYLFHLVPFAWLSDIELKGKKNDKRKLQLEFSWVNTCACYEGTPIWTYQWNQWNLWRFYSHPKAKALILFSGSQCLNESMILWVRIVVTVGLDDLGGIFQPLQFCEGWYCSEGLCWW